jgi:hypothetical protein
MNVEFPHYHAPQSLSLTSVLYEAFTCYTVHCLLNVSNLSYTLKATEKPFKDLPRRLAKCA